MDRHGLPQMTDIIILTARPAFLSRQWLEMLRLHRLLVPHSVHQSSILLRTVK